ncbi:hypothetical protein Pmani_015773 [Petrolisthes manimaculis]|uniref:Sushi domain-containing protein n=1 Tax=Petrolisthes manimaculis TaxID=1843537 RepID=A0AAE1PT66_9EUCA|nr:hypothetical protein Pmani_015773 [Petrolisthes manimaculis]
MYKLTGDSTVTCSNAQWLGRFPVCLHTNHFFNYSDVTCDPISVNDPNIQVEGDSYDLASVITFTCNEGYDLLGSDTLTCLPSGVWSSPTPQCQVVRCPALAPDDPRLQLREANTTYKGVAAFYCVSGFVLVGEANIICTENGTWSQGMPMCQEVVCPEVTPPLHGDVTGGGYGVSGRGVGDAVTFTCRTGFVIRGHSLAFCTHDGKWSRPVPQCK